jgi:UDP-N-acetylglucosamine acyltransferase
VIHATAIIDNTAKVCNNVHIGPFCLIGPYVVLNDGIELKSHIIEERITVIGKNTVIYLFASTSHSPQDLKYSGEQSQLIIGNNNVIREYATIHPGTKCRGMITIIGNDCLFMVGDRIAHDCTIGNNVILANHVSLTGHVYVYDYVIIGGLSAVLQYVRIGQYAMIGGMSAVDKNVIPFGLVKNDRATLNDLNLVGMKRRRFDVKQTLESTKVINKLLWI